MYRNQEFHFPTTHIGSMPHQVVSSLAERLNSRLDIPAWPQLPRRSFRESMYVQYTPSLPSIREDSRRRLIYFDTADMAPALERFYLALLSDDLGAFALQPDYSAGFFAMRERLLKTPGEWAKGQVTGPVSLGLAISDQDQRASLYDDTLRDVIIKNVAMNARWQIRQLKCARSNIVMFVDEPYLSFFGSAFLVLDRAQLIPILDEVLVAIQREGAWAGVHCCGNTDWGLLLSTKTDILNLDAFGYVENLSLYPVELHEYLSRGGSICWGIVPNDARVNTETSQSLADRLRKGMKLITARAGLHGVRIRSDDLAAHSLLAPTCGGGDWQRFESRLVALIPASVSSSDRRPGRRWHSRQGPRAGGRSARHPQVLHLRE
jgi:hypothetical protein